MEREHIALVLLLVLLLALLLARSSIRRLKQREGQLQKVKPTSTNIGGLV